MEIDQDSYGFPFKIPLKATSFGLLFIGIVLNFLGKFCTMHLGAVQMDGYVVPGYLWLDSIGTIFSAAALGPFAGAVVGLLSNLLNMLQDPNAVFYAMVSVAIGFFVGCLYPRTRLTPGALAFMTTTMIAIVVLLCGPLNFIFYGGEPGTYLGNVFYGKLEQMNVPKVACALLAEFVVEIPDKVISLAAASGLYVVYRKRFEERIDD